MIIIAGPCVAESLELCKMIACHLKTIEGRINSKRTDKIKFYFKASFDKANRSSIHSYRGPGIEKGLKFLQTVKETFNIPVTSDIHECWQAELAGKVLDIVQIPSYLSRQTDLLIAAAHTGKTVNVKKAQFSNGPDMKNVVNKLIEAGCKDYFVTERGSCFGQKLVNDFTDLVEIRKFSKVIYDGGHSVQFKKPGDDKTSGNRDMIEPLSRAAFAVGLDGFFCEVHPDPSKALSDGPNSYKLDEFEGLLERLLVIHDLQNPYVIRANAPSVDPYVNFPLIDERF
jgi:2-dehydro-3-deoxyphosphooctonate aldolase (KDO 8-P synthase)